MNGSNKTAQNPLFVSQEFLCYFLALCDLSTYQLLKNYFFFFFILSLISATMRIVKNTAISHPIMLLAIPVASKSFIPNHTKNPIIASQSTVAKNSCKKQILKHSSLVVSQFQYTSLLSRFSSFD